MAGPHDKAARFQEVLAQTGIPVAQQTPAVVEAALANPEFRAAFDHNMQLRQGRTGSLLGQIVEGVGDFFSAVGEVVGITSLSNVDELDSPALDLAFPTVFSQDVHAQAARAGAVQLYAGSVAERPMFDFSNPLEAGDWWSGNEELYLPTFDDLGVDWNAVAAGWEGLAADSAAQNAALASGSSFGWLDTIWSGARPLLTEYVKQEILDDYRPDMPQRPTAPARPSIYPLAPLGAVRGDPLAQPAVKSLLTVGALALVGFVAFKALKKGAA